MLDSDTVNLALEDKRAPREVAFILCDGGTVLVVGVMRVRPRICQNWEAIAYNRLEADAGRVLYWLPRARITSAPCPRRLARIVETPSGLPDAAQLTRPTPSLVSVTFVGQAVISPVERATARSL